ncbi:MAG: hypothetical protein WA252_20820 [Candidatus Sulfotelmatobacter sp.]
MQLVITFIAVVAGLVFSLAVAVATEELIFGRLMQLFFRPQPAAQNVPRKAKPSPS